MLTHFVQKKHERYVGRDEHGEYGALMERRYVTASDFEAKEAVKLLRDQGFTARAESAEVILEHDSVEAVELMLRRAPSATPVR